MSDRRVVCRQIDVSPHKNSMRNSIELIVCNDAVVGSIESVILTIIIVMVVARPRTQQSRTPSDLLCVSG